jgi:putative ABC transport system permease protein
MRLEATPLTYSAWLVYSLAITIISVLLWRYTQDLKLTLTAIGAGLLVIILFGFGIYFLLSLSRHCLPKLSITWRFGLQGIIRHPQASASQIIAFSTTLVAMLVSYTVSTDLLADWKAQLPDKAPNHFALNIFPAQRASFEQDLKNLKIPDSHMYPVVRGRLTHINGTPVQQIVSKESQGERATHRDLSLTWSTTLPEANKITSGKWWTANKKNQLSIEQKLAKSLKVNVGDRLNFTVGSEQFSAVIANIRALNWDTMKPNFYMIFSPDTLENYATTYITSFYLPQAKKNDLNFLVKKYPGLTILEVDIILKQIKNILAQLTQTIHFVLLFALFAGFTVLLAAIYATLDRRIYDGALLRSLGANRRLLILSQIIEFSSLGFISGMLAVIISEILTWILYTMILNMDFAPNYLYWFMIPLSAAMFIGIVGYWGVRNVPNKSPMLVLRDLS